MIGNLMRIYHFNSKLFIIKTFSVIAYRNRTI